ncbi:MAG TPA: hydantoinase/oxoprolinase family protein [Burkholderiales bacterium]|nr:hydantoinase/oxoprolinase family protein [Burkholderiales bacterium]
MYRIGIDVGGTFTDFTLLREEDGQVSYHKVASTPRDPSQAIEQGIADLLRMHTIAPAQVGHVGHGTTVATNLVIERRGALTGLLTTRGFRDVIEIGRQVRPHLFDYNVVKPPPLAAREHRHEISERVDAHGTVIAALDEREVEAAANKLKAAGVKSVAVCFLHSYRNPAHEQAARRVVERVLPAAYVSISSDVLPEFREYERWSTTLLNAAVGPRMETYLEGFLSRVKNLGIAVEPFTIHSNGGLMSMRAVRAYPVRTCLSGPAAGVVGAAEIGRVAGFENLVTFDVGGTSTDVSLVYRGKPLFSSSRLVADYPVKTPMIDIHVIGAGGGSIAWMDDAGALKVGPKSAGADPGPAAYSRGGVEPTITDAQITLHRLNPVALLDGRLKVDEKSAREVIDKKVAQPLGLALEQAAEGVIRIANANMSRAIRSVSTERGYDLSRFALFAYGGAGPLHAIDVAIECGILTVIVPQEPGTLCARGILLTDISFDFVRSEIAEVTAESWRHVCKLFVEMETEAGAWLERERVPRAEQSFRYHIDARYQGQNFEVMVPMPRIAADGMASFLQQYAAAHQREYGYDVPGRAVEIVNCRLQAVGAVAKAPLREIATGGSVKDAVTAQRKTYFGVKHGWLDTPVHARAKLPAGAMLAGPALIEEMSSTVLLAPGQSASVDRIGNIVINTGRAA